MKTKPMSPSAHGIADYAFGLASLTVPALLGANKNTTRLYQAIGVEVLLYGALTDYRFALKRLLPLHMHRNIDVLNLAGIALLSACEQIKSDKRIFRFNLALLSVGLVSVLLTDWSNKR
ncbi:hypothetical protein [Pedobacter endophyticus]|uniref:Uncharacterized protein n=1 Tax=Pedobacter endophyticus TaxID=2789740 RepID=A0A7S9Q0J0_9SPHI|nr:hypothetical protein [Pedobacter endophyticus]QPH40836.1 hypothetical protein IZT61_06100 [Pedobacter endophyticus]